ncbi:hypothetical protein [Nonomuraea guangzhouensis]|uniref:Transporter n=1 Tax=Nonomuraea guangzhouensis TaxID=1291555 RepID=A0ABW4FZC3_9ACTN|nr:hypothetical protein [Nonomuraea guangzhouensis]
MMWMAWRQHRKQVLFAAVGLVVLAAVLIPTGLAMRADFTGSGLAACLGGLGSAEFLRPGTDCTALSREFTGQYDLMAMFGTLLVFLPLLVGLFWGAPLVARELEQGTYRLVWTQGVSRLRWALVKTAFVVVVTVAVSTCYALLLSWWLTPLNDAGRVRLAELSFDVQGVVPVAYTLFAVALGILAGTIWRRVTPAMAAAVVGFLTVRFVVLSQLRGHLLPVSERIYPVVGGKRPNPALGDWTFASGIKNAQGEVLVTGQQAQCSAAVSGDPSGPCAAFGKGAYNFQLYQPGSNFWPLQLIEAGLFTLLAVVLIYVAIRQIRYRIA